MGIPHRMPPLAMLYAKYITKSKKASFLTISYNLFEIRGKIVVKWEYQKKEVITMYDNIGGKLKGLAKVLFIVPAIAAVLAGIVLMSTDEHLILYGLLVMVVGPIVAWISSWFLYGFGELIDKACDIERNTR